MAKRRKAAAEALTLPGLEVRAAPGAVSPAARAMSRRGSRSAPAPVPWAWQCVVLAVDTADRSGYAVWHAGEVMQSGEVETKNAARVREIVAGAVVMAGVAHEPCVLVLEKPFGGTVMMVSALGAAKERWMAPWRDLAIGHQGKVVSVTPSEWRGPVLGAYYANIERSVARAREQEVAASIVGRQVGGDEAPAVCIGQWAMHAQEIGVLIGKRFVRKSMAGGEP